MSRFLLALLVAPLAASAQPARVIPMQDADSGRWGFRAEGDTAWVLAPRFDGVWPWPHDLVLGYTEVERGGRKGLVVHGDGDARLVLPLAYDYVGHQGESGWHLFGRDSLVWVRQDGLEGYLNGRTWEPVLPDLYENLWGGGPYFAGERGGVWHLFRRREGPPWYETIPGVTFDSLGQYVAYRESQDRRFDPDRDRLSAQRDGRWALLNGRLEPLTPYAYDDIAFHYALYRVRVGDRYGLLGRDGRVLLDPAYDEVAILGPITGRSPGWQPEANLRWARVRRGGRWALAGLWTGRVGAFRFDWVHPVDEADYAAPYLRASEAGRVGVVDGRAVMDGKAGWLIPPRFDGVLAFDHESGEARVRLGDDRFWVDGEGHRIDRE